MLVMRLSRRVVRHIAWLSRLINRALARLFGSCNGAMEGLGLLSDVTLHDGRR